jgi:hypothetical protein
MSEQKRTRSDYRTEQPISLRGYLLHNYPKGLDFTTQVAGWHPQLHETEKDTKGNWMHLDGQGRPDLSHKFVDELCGIPHVTFRKAIERVEADDPTAIKVLRWHQQTYKAPRHRFAYDIGVTAQHLTNLLNRAVTMVREALPDEARWAVEKVERENRLTEIEEAA